MQERKCSTCGPHRIACGNIGKGGFAVRRVPVIIRLLHPITLLGNLIAVDKLRQPFLAVDPVPGNNNGILTAWNGHEHFASRFQKIAKLAHGF